MVVLAAGVYAPGEVEAVHCHILTCDCLMPALGTAFQSHTDLADVLFPAGWEAKEARHLLEEIVGVVSEVEEVVVHLERGSSAQS